MDIEYTITEVVYRDSSGQVTQVDYQFDETIVTETTGSSSSLARQNTEKRNRTYDIRVNREQYPELASQLSNVLSFDSFIDVLRPFIMGYYADDELERAFKTLDRDQSGNIHFDELSSFLPIINEAVDSDALLQYVQKIDDNFDGRISYDEFRSLVLRGIGRDIVCNCL